jgi:hypothetical protein
MTSIVRADNISTVAGTGTVTVQAGNTLYAPGHVIQVIGANDIITATNTNSTSFTATTLTATITPTSTSSKIYVSATFSATQDGGSNIQSQVTIYRGATNLRPSGTCLFMYDHPGGNVGFSGTYQIYDSPATTSATTYTVYVKVADASSFFRAVAGTDTITLMEIAG